MKENQVAYKHDFDGEFAPTIKGTYDSSVTFSVGIFVWLPKISGKGLKKSKVKYRIRGKLSDYEKVYERARERCKYFDDICERCSDPLTQKSETIK